MLPCNTPTLILPYQTLMCVTAQVHITTHTPVALAPPVQQLNALHRHVTSTHPVISLMAHTGDDID